MPTIDEPKPIALLDLDDARLVFDAVGSRYQHLVADKLKTATLGEPEDESEEAANRVLTIFEANYVRVVGTELFERHRDDLDASLVARIQATM